MIGRLMELAYLVAAVIFIYGLKWMASPTTARKGNALSAQLIIVGMVVSSALGVWMVRAVKMTAMLQMVGLLNGFGGGAS